ncbi:type VI lipase adapter Tla3 domain-containing protein [Duganella vulcania]|uniref:DUF2875 domain-containing protein n=1 Tax=Duganella vulcania TaxID=2692166 RepID=A0A845GGG4_9BURK|nr:DUF2875 family protein [Duganella vulcania]MYM93394.1 DUF2875 domain-containing protein [Duganella vulcania]
MNVTVQPPKLWKYLLGAFIALIILIPLWTLFVMVVVQPNSLMMQEQTMGNRLWWWAVGPVAVVGLVLGARWMMVTQQARASEQQSRAHMQVHTQHAAATGQARNEYVLEVIGLGVTLDKYRQGKLWEALQKGSPYVTIREQDPNKYPWSGLDKGGVSGGRGGDTLENGAQYTPMYYGVPVFNAEPPVLDPAMIDKQNDPRPGLAEGAVSSGMAWHLFAAGPRRFGERPDHILEDVFAFFDANPDVPYIVLNSDDSMEFRDTTRPPNEAPLLRDGYYIPEMPDSSALFVLARRERVDPVRPFVWDDPDNDFLQNTLRWMYYTLKQSVPHPERKEITRTPAQVGADPTQRRQNEGPSRTPLVSEWLEAAAAFANRPDVRGTGLTHVLDGVNPLVHRPPKDWRPTPWFPVPWNREQLATFDRLPTLGYIHRPTFVKFSDANGQPLTRRDEREKALQSGWQEALRTLPEAERAKAPARIIAATGGNSSQTIALHSLLTDQAAHGGPEIDSGKSSQFIDTDKRLGNTGAATLFVQMAIGVMGSYRDGGISAAVNLRDTNEASIVFISPPSDEKRKTQKHPKGGDVFAHHGTPAVDPANYPSN